MTENLKEGIRNVVRVHGGFVDGSGWEGVYNILKNDGYNIAIVQNPTITLEDDVAVTKRAIDAQDGPVILVGHSYGGVGISSAGADPKGVRAFLNFPFPSCTGDFPLSFLTNAPPPSPPPPPLPPHDSV